MILMANEWYFINDIRDSNGSKFNFVNIDRDVLSGGSVHEHFAITITKEELYSFSQADKRFKVIGKKGNGVFTVSKHLSSAFLKSIEQRAEN